MPAFGFSRDRCKMKRSCWMHQEICAIRVRDECLQCFFCSSDRHIKRSCDTCKHSFHQTSFLPESSSASMN
ncbi:unnamed protein product [Rhodiola kirilowii]